MGTKGTQAVAPEPDPGGAIARLHRGEISLEEYADECVEEGIRHLQGKVSVERLAFIRKMIREQVEADPALTEYMAKIAGFARAARRER